MEGLLLYLLAPQELSITRIRNLHLTQHLAHDHFDMLIVDLHALQTINRLHLVHQILLQILRTTHFQQLLRNNRSFRQLLSLVNKVTRENNHVLVHRDQMLLLAARNRVANHDLPLTFSDAAQLNNSLDLSDLSRILRRTRFHQLRHPWQTTGNILCTNRFTRRTSQCEPSRNFLFRLNHHLRTCRNRIETRFLLVLRISNHNLRMQIFLMLHHHKGFDTGRFIDTFLHRHTLNEVVELHFTVMLGKNRNRVGIPLNKRLARLHFGAIVHRHLRTDHHRIPFQLATLLIHDNHVSVLIQDDVLRFHFHRTNILILHNTRRLRIDSRLLKDRTRRTPDMERTHRQLRTRLTD